MMSIAPAFTILILSFLVLVESNPGLQTHITKNGLDYANKVAIGILTNSIRGTTIPDMKGKASHVKYTLSHLQIKQFTNPSSSIKLAPPGGLIWQASNINVAVHGHYKYTYKKGKLPKRGKGSFDVKVLRMTFSLKLLLDADVTGRPTINTSGCTSSIGSVHFKFHGGEAFILNLFRKNVEHAIKSTLNKKLCDMIKNLVDVNGKKSLAKLKVLAKIGKRFVLDYRLLKPPLFTPEYMETIHKGEVYWNSSRKDVPFTAPVFPKVRNSSRMFYIWMSDFVVNSLMYQAQQHDFLHFNFTAKNLPPTNRSLLNTTCNPIPFSCIGSFIPALQKLPGCHVELHMKNKLIPNVNVSNGHITTRTGGDVTMFASCPKQKDLKYLFTLDVNATAYLSLVVKNQSVHFKMNSIKMQVTVTKTAIKEINKFGLKILTAIIQGFLKETVKDLGAQGIPLPLTSNVRLVNTSLLLKQDTLLIETDVNYRPG